jgi:hypothetical protein
MKGFILISQNWKWIQAVNQRIDSSRFQPYPGSFVDDTVKFDEALRLSRDRRMTIT